MSPATQTTLSALLAKSEDKDPNCRKSSLEAIKELMQREVVHEKSMTDFIDTLLGTLDKKRKHFVLLSSSDQSPYSQLAYSSAFLLAEMAHHATHQHLKLSLHHIASIVKHLVSWLPLDMGTGSQSHSLHLACAKLVCSLAENTALVVNDDITKSSCSSSPSFTHITSHGTSELNDSSSSSSSNTNEDSHHNQYCALAMESFCRPLMAALCSKVEPRSKGATTCLEALVSMESWRFAFPSLIEELCLRAVNVMQERTVLSVSIAQMSLLSNLAKKNHGSLSCFRAGLLKKGVDILLNNGAWQQRVAAARMIECLLGMGNCGNMRSKHDKQATMHAIESLEQCRLDKVAMVRSAVIEALKESKQQQTGPDKGNAISTPGVPSTSSCSTVLKTSKVDYRKRRRKKPLNGPCNIEKQPAFSSPAALIRRDPLSRWINKVTPSSGWSSSDSVNSSIDVKCPRKKVARTGAWNGKTTALCGKNGQLKSSSSTLSSSSSSVAITPSSASSSCNPADMMMNRSIPHVEETMESASHASHKFMGSLLTESNSSGMELSISCPEEEDDVCVTHKGNATGNHDCGAEEKCNYSCATPTYIHHNPLAQLESLEEVEIHEVCKSATKLTEDVLSATPISLLLPKLEHIKLQYTDVAEGMKRTELLNDAAWNVRNNPIATDDSELDSPRATGFDSCSIVYCDDGDDDDDVKVQERHPDVKDNHAVHAREHQEGDDFVVDKRQYEHFEDVDSDDGFVDPTSRDCSSGYSSARKEHQGCGTDDGRKQQVIDTLGDHVICNDCRVDSYDENGDVEVPEELLQGHQHGSSLVCLSEDDSANYDVLLSKEDTEALPGEYKASVLVLKEMLMEGGEILEHDSIIRAFVGHNMSACKSVPKMYCNDCHCLLQDSSAENCTLKENEGSCSPAGSSTLCTEDGGIDHPAIKEVANLENHMSNQQEHSYHADDPHPLVAIHEHEGIGDNFDLFAHPNENHQGLCNEADWESPRHEGHIILKPANIDMEALQECSLQKSFACGDEDESRGDSGEGSGNSVVGWLRECYVVKKVGAFGALFIALTIPLAIVSIINTFDTKKEAIDFLIPT